MRIKAYLLCSIIAIQKKKVNEKSKAKEKRMQHERRASLWSQMRTQQPTCRDASCKKEIV